MFCPTATALADLAGAGLIVRFSVDVPYHYQSNGRESSTNASEDNGGEAIAGLSSTGFWK